MRGTTENLETGEWGEKQAERMLKRKGYRILGRRVRVGTRDEIDLVARDGATLVFVEVKTRKSEDLAGPCRPLTGRNATQCREPRCVT